MNIGGPSRQIALLHLHLGLADNDHILVIGEVSEFEFEADLSFSRNVHRIKSLKRGINPFLDIATTLALIRVIRIEKPDIIHTHLSKAWLLGLIANELSRNKSVMIHTFHGHTLVGYFQGLFSELLIKIQKKAASSTDFLITVGKKISNDLLILGIGTPQKFKVIYPGVFTDRALEVENKDQDKINLLYVGRLEPIKKPQFLLQICRELELLSISYQLIVVGQGSMFEEIRHLAEKEKLDIAFHGWQQEIGEFLHNADLLLLGSISEGTPIVIVEAATFAVPTLTTNVGAINEMITNGVSGFIEPDTIAFAEKIRYLSENRGVLTSAGSRAHSEMSVKFGLPQFITAHKDLYSLAIQTRLEKRQNEEKNV